MKRPIELDYTSYVAYARALEEYCDWLENTPRMSDTYTLIHPSGNKKITISSIPIGWAVQGCSKMWQGEYAELDAKAEARRIMGTCVAYPLYTHT